MLSRSKSSNFNQLLKISKKFIYFDHVEGEINRNIDFVFNLGFNQIPSIIKPNIGFIKLSKFIMKRKLLYRMKHYYKNLLESIENGEIQIFDEILEKNLKFSLYSDLSKFYEKNYSFKIANSNKNEPILLKILNVYELADVSVNREMNPEISEKDILYSLSSNRIFIKTGDNDSYELKRLGKTYIDTLRERENFEKSKYKEIAFNKLKSEVRVYYGMEYAKKKLANNYNQKNVEYISNLIDQLEGSEKRNDPYSQEIRLQFSDYFDNRQKFIDEKLKSTDLYEYFKINLPSHYETFLLSYEASLGIFKRLINSIRKRFNKRLLNRKYFSKTKTLYVIDVEVTSKMRLEIFDEKNNNVLDSVYNYSRKMEQTSNNYLINNNELLSYDTGIYKFSIPDRKWNYKNDEFMQTHVIRFEYEKKNQLKNIFRNSYDTLMITDIDLTLKGNKHFKLIKNYI